MPRVPAAVAAFVLATALHIDAHLGRPEHEHLGLGWSYHWVATAAVFALVGWFIARRWPEHRWRLGVAAFVGGVLIAQGIEPAAEVLIYEGRLGYNGEPERWAVFWTTMLAATPAFFAALWLCVRRPSLARAS